MEIILIMIVIVNLIAFKRILIEKIELSKKEDKLIKFKL